MPKVTAHMSISLDGFVAGPHQTLEDPLGVRGEELHTWHLGQTGNEVDLAMTARILAPRGAYIMGRNMYGPVRGDWAGVYRRGLRAELHVHRGHAAVHRVGDRYPPRQSGSALDL